jgi:hypothetical protein
MIDANIIFDLSKFIQSEFTYSPNSLGIPGIICKENVEAGAPILIFPLQDNIVLSDNELYDKLVDKCPGVDQLYVQMFCLATRLIGNYDKLSKIYDISQRSFFMNEAQLALMKNTISYSIVKKEQTTFNTVLTAYMNEYHNVTYEIEQKLKLLYCFANSYAFGIKLNNIDYRCIHPGIYFNHKPSEIVPKLKHALVNNIYTISTEKDYVKGDELFECYNTTHRTFANFPLYDNLVLNDWRIFMTSFYGPLMELSNDPESGKHIQGFKLKNNEDVDGRKLLMIRDLFHENIENKDVSIDSLSTLAIRLRNMECSHYMQFMRFIKFL